VLYGLADGLDALVAQGARVGRILLVGGGARSAGATGDRADRPRPHPVIVPAPGEYVADGAARQACSCR
jgi:xylulokinase